MTRTPKVPELDTPRTVERTVKQPRLSYIDKQTHPTGGIIHVLKTAGYGLIERMSAGGRNLASIAAALGIDPKTLRDMRDRDPARTTAAFLGLSLAIPATPSKKRLLSRPSRPISLPPRSSRPQAPAKKRRRYR